MKIILVIAKKDFISYISSPSFLIFSALLNSIAAWLFFQDLFVVNIADLSSYFSILGLLMILYVPAVTMGSLADEKRNGNWEWLTSLPIRDYQIVWGKYIGALLNTLISLVPALIIVAITQAVGQLDFLKVVAGGIGVVLLAAAYTALGLLAGAIGSTSIAAMILGITIIGLNYLMGQGMILNRLPGNIGTVVGKLSAATIASGIYQGRISLQDLSIIMAIIIFGVAGAQIWLRRREG